MASAQPHAGTGAPTPPKPPACAPPDEGFGRYGAYLPIPRGRVTLPEVDALPPEGGFDLLVHFHFFDAVRRVMVEGAHPMVLAGFDLGEGSKAYADTFRDGAVLARGREAIEAAMRAKYGPTAHVKRLFLSSWSAGSGATAVLLKRRDLTIDGVVLLDSLYAAYERETDGTVRTGKIAAPLLATWVDYAKRARKGERFLFLTYSGTPTTGYASTGEVAHHLEGALGLHVSKVATEDPRGRMAALDVGGLHLRGYRGGDARAHCNHLGYARDAVAAIMSR